jgi:hypothetical protein
MQAINVIASFCRPVLQSSNPFSAPDRATRYLIAKRAEQIELARRFWACPF